jgi:hypothetical protein
MEPILRRGLGKCSVQVGHLHEKVPACVATIAGYRICRNEILYLPAPVFLKEWVDYINGNSALPYIQSGEQVENFFPTSLPQKLLHYSAYLMYSYRSSYHHTGI